MSFVLIGSEVPALENSIKTAIYSILASSNLYLLFESLSYYSSNSSLNLFLHTWSLAIEQQFYFIFPVLMLYLHRQRKSHKTIIIILSFLALSSLVLYIHEYTKNFNVAFYSIFHRAWELLAGGLVFHLNAHGYLFKKKLFSFLPRIIFSLFFLMILSPIETNIYLNISTVVLSALFFFTSIESHSKKTLNIILIRKIGMISYSLYLWHWPIYSLYQWIAPHNYVSKILLIAVSFLAAIGSYVYVESPFRKNIPDKGPRTNFTKFFSALVALIFLSFFILGTLRLSAQVEFDEGPTYTRANSIQEFLTEEHSGELTTLIKNCLLTPQYLDVKNSPPTINSNWLDNCLSGNQRKIILLGDSFANVVSPTLFKISKELGYDFKMIFGYGCPYPFSKSDLVSPTARRCDADPVLIRERVLKNLNPGDIVVVRIYYQKRQYITNMDPAAYNQAIVKLDREVSKKGGLLILVDTNPSLSSERSEVCSQIKRNHYNFHAMKQCSHLDLSNSSSNRFAQALYPSLLALRRDERLSLGLLPITETMCNSRSQTCNLENPREIFRADGYHIDSGYFYFNFGSSLKDLVVKNRMIDTERL